MADPALPVIRDVLDHAWDVGQRLAIEVIDYPSDKRGEVMQRIDGLLTEVACDAGCTREMAIEFDTAMEQVICDYVSEIEASGGGTIGIA